MEPILWNRQHELFLKKLKNEIYCMSEIHKYVAMNYARKNKYLGTPSILIGTVAASSVFSNSDIKYMVYINGTLVLISTMMTSLRNWLDYDNRSAGHKQQSIEYESLAIDIGNELNNDIHHRMNVDEFMKTIKDRYIALKKTPLNIPDHVYEKFMDEVETFMSKLTDKEIVIIDNESSTSEKIMSWFGCCRHKTRMKDENVQTPHPSHHTKPSFSIPRESPMNHRSIPEPRMYRSRSGSECDSDDDESDTIVVTKRPIEKNMSSYHMTSLQDDFHQEMDPRLCSIV
jgi:hypothetical protein